MCITLDQFPDTTPVTLIDVDSELGLKIGLTSKTFVPTNQCSDDYKFGTRLFRSGNCMYIQAIEVWITERQKHHFDRLLDTLWNLGFTVKVPNVFPLMHHILKMKGFAEYHEQNPTSSSPDIDAVMVKEPPTTILF